MFELEPLLMYGYYALALGLCAVVYRRSAVVKDFEYNNAKAMRKIKHVYEQKRKAFGRPTPRSTMPWTKPHAGLSRSVAELSGELLK